MQPRPRSYKERETCHREAAGTGLYVQVLVREEAHPGALINKYNQRHESRFKSRLMFPLL